MKHFAPLRLRWNVFSTPEDNCSKADYFITNHRCPVYRFTYNSSLGSEQSKGRHSKVELRRFSFHTLNTYTWI